MEKQSASAGTGCDKMLRKTDGNFQFLHSFFYFRAIRYENFALHTTRVNTKNEWKIPRSVWIIKNYTFNNCIRIINIHIAIKMSRLIYVFNV